MCGGIVPPLSEADEMILRASRRERDAWREIRDWNRDARERAAQEERP